MTLKLSIFSPCLPPSRIFFVFSFSFSFVSSFSILLTSFSPSSPFILTHNSLIHVTNSSYPFFLFFISFPLLFLSLSFFPSLLHYFLLPSFFLSLLIFLFYCLFFAAVCSYIFLHQLYHSFLDETHLLF